MCQSMDKLTTKYLWKIATQIHSECPQASRYFIFNLEKRLIDNSNLFKPGMNRHMRYCQYCGNIWMPDNHQVRIKCPKTNQHIKKLIKIQKIEPWKLNIHQRKKLRKFNEETSKIVYTCFTCKKKTTFPGRKKTRNTEADLKTSTPLPIMKIKRRDFNAGLFITPAKDNQTPTLKRDEKKNQLKSKGPSKMSPISSHPSKIASKDNTRKSRRKSLLTQVLEKEQQRSSKTNLSSFLISL